ncbi:MAG: alanine racemase [Clostridiales Family XIII bacterium]|jgi:alanine racemase|nr:alanine racemase [Clostridiales Family XIII bacterium]
MYNETRRAAWTEINLSAIKQNYRRLRSLSEGSEVIASVKGDAYGHGAVKVSWELVKAGVEFLGVATLSEAAELRAAGIQTPVVLFGATPRGNVKDVLDLRIIPLITTFEDARLLSETAAQFTPDRTAYVFIGVETGMGRLGFLGDAESHRQVAAIHALPHIHIKGLFSHFAAADSADLGYSFSQVEKLLEFERKIGELGVTPGYRTIANSAAVASIPEARFEAVRPGISLYGLYPSAHIDRARLPLTPAMSVKANIVYLKTVPPGSYISYGRRFVTERESLIATLPLGYADGLPRVLTGKGRVLVGGTYAPIVGTICMDQCMADVTDIAGVKEYDEVVLMGTQGDKTITADEIAEQVGTINYEVATRFGQRLPKVYLHG